MTLLHRAANWASQHPTLAVFVLALTVRGGAAIAITVFRSGVLIPDERQYLVVSGLAADGHLTDALWDGYGAALYRTTRAFTWPLTAIFWVAGPHRLLAQLLVAILGAVTAAITTRLARDVVRPSLALAAGMVVALVPSQVLWSSVVLRESTVWTLMLVVALCAVRLVQARSCDRIVRWMLLAAAALVSLGYARSQTAVIAAWAFALTIVLFARRARVAQSAAAVLVLVLAPLLANHGPAGWTLIDRSAPNLARTRTNLSIGADSAIVPTSTVTVPSRPSSAGRGHPAVDPSDPCTAAGTGICTRSGEDEIVISDGGADADVRQFPRGLLATLARPYPWEETDGLALLLARLENVGWFGLYALAVVGLAVAAVRRRRELAYPVIACGAIIVVAALSQGNVGTAFRHRAQILWGLALLAAVAADHFVGQRRATGRAAAKEVIEVPA